jgi:hypothetical protein
MGIAFDPFSDLAYVSSETPSRVIVVDPGSEERAILSE